MAEIWGINRCRGCGKELSMIFPWHKNVCQPCKRKEEEGNKKRL